MTDKEFNDEKARIRKFVKKWANVFEMEQWSMTYVFERDMCEEQPETVAHTWGRWHYRHATITFFLLETKQKEDDELERSVIHELMHIILLPMSQNLTEGHQDEHEYVTVSLQRIAARAYIMGLKEKRPQAKESLPKTPSKTIS